MYEMKITHLLSIADARASPLQSFSTVRDVEVQAEGEPSQWVTLLGYEAESFAYVPGQTLLLHLELLEGVPGLKVACTKLACIG